MPSKTVDNIKKILVIAGYDPSGGAGLLSDLKTIHSLGGYALCIPTCLTIQDTQKVYEVFKIDEKIILKNLEIILSDCMIDAVKIGVLYSKNIISIVCNIIKKYNLKNIVLDPIIRPTTGVSLLEESALEELKNLISLCDIITPNIPEAEILTKIKIKNIEDAKLSAKILRELGAKTVVIKGGHWEGEKIIDILFKDNNFYIKSSKRINTEKEVHGTGCTFSSALATFLAMGYDYYSAFLKTKNYIIKSIKNAINIGKGKKIINISFDKSAPLRI
ncbi:MAG: bifunctional hydroxymethylpyrimidine kinase/phosphomethylpyrimidine kinase [Dictyoglomus sp.]|nr:bifunctional hydroxymethylpyrimidine kinase/phosphomethylpyrimidine kinase [Dictyoglomus sp.]MCX7942091.1 bifunctional hydroxymethylpyrimidine kinase/phosphomethylpyrimidine kinase [Dictyoglomaceae bacterium]MDW8187938.1 bifunctional hydroxymethylpyrimidine kinase/phosphomethylpyrimidine kinase [Dictyoglomus sp.]